tara:strand:- start:2614 stop:3105 length:492 start_codon:yes stop_codon:yes gene_type:complete
MSWQQILKQPQLSMGDVGLVDLSNVPEEDPKCKPKFLKMIEKLKNHFKAYPALGSWDKVNQPSHILWEIYRKDYNTPLVDVSIRYDDSLEDSEYCEILEGLGNDNSFVDIQPWWGDNTWQDIWNNLDDRLNVIVTWDTEHKDMDAVREATIRAVFNILEGAWT